MIVKTPIIKSMRSNPDRKGIRSEPKHVDLNKYSSNHDEINWNSKKKDSKKKN